MKKMFAPKNTWIFILFFTLTILCTTHKAYGQNESKKFDFLLKVNAGLLFNKNTLDSPFDPKVGACFGSYLTARYNFTRLGISTGIGVESFSFSEELDFRIIPDEIGYSTLRMNYLALSVPILVHYSLSDRFDIYGGVNIIWVNWMSLGIGVTGPQNSDLNVNHNNNISNWQFAQEAMLGLNYKISQRVELGFNVAQSLGTIQGLDVDMEFFSADQDSYNVSGKFDYSWTRVNLELVFRLNK